MSWLYTIRECSFTWWPKTIFLLLHNNEISDQICMRFQCRNRSELAWWQLQRPVAIHYLQSLNCSILSHHACMKIIKIIYCTFKHFHSNYILYNSWYALCIIFHDFHHSLWYLNKNKGSLPIKCHHLDC